MIANYHLIVDFARPSKTNTIVVAENDAETRNCNFKLLFDKEPFDMTGVVTATVKGVTQRGATIWDTAEIKTDGEGNYINELSYLLPLAVTENAGNVTMTITLEGDNNQTITSFEFYIRARNTLYNEDDVIDEEDLEGFRDLLVRSQQALARMEEMVERDALPNPFPIRQTVDGYVFEYTGNEIVEVDMDDVAYLGDYAGYVDVTEDDSAAEVALQAAAEAAESARVAAESVEGVDETAQEVRNIVDNLESIIPTANVTKTGHTATITVQDQHGTTTAEVEDGQDGQDGAIGVTPSITAVVTVDDNTGTPSCTVTKTGTDENPTLTFEFENLKGEKGDPGSGASVEWGEVYGDIEDQSDLKAKLDGEIDLLKDTVGWTGKNLIPYPYLQTTRTINRVTFTDNADGTITVDTESSGASAFSQFICHDRYNTEHNEYFLPNGTYILSGCPSGGSSSSYRIGVVITKNGTYQYLGFDTGSSVEVTVNGDDYSNDGAYLGIVIDIASGAIISNKVFKPMLRLASINDATYEPYHKPVKQTLRDAEVIEGKNLISYPYYDTTNTQGNITFTDNGDGTVTVSGSATANSFFRLVFREQKKDLGLKAGDVVKITCENMSASGQGAVMTVRFLDSDDTTLLEKPLYDLEVEATVPNNYHHMNIYFYVVSGKTYSSPVTFKPMLRLATEEDATYEPYYIPLKDSKFDRSEQGILGAKNLIPYPYSNTTKTENNITFTDNGDGTVTVTTGTGGASAYTRFYLKLTSDAFNLPNGRYILSSDSSNSNVRAQISLYNGSTYTGEYYNTRDGEVQFTLGNSPARDRLGIEISIQSGTEVSNLLIKPMLRLASDPDDTWQPYAMTNRELTGKVGTLAPLASPALTGTPTAPTATAGTNTTQIATTAFVKTAIDTAITQVMSASY